MSKGGGGGGGGGGGRGGRSRAAGGGGGVASAEELTGEAKGYVVDWITGGGDEFINPKDYARIQSISAYEMNKALYGGKPMTLNKQFYAEKLKTSMEGIRDYKGTAVRFMKDRGQGVAGTGGLKIASQYTVGKVTTVDAFSAATQGRKLSVSFKQSKDLNPWIDTTGVKLTIKSKHGKALGKRLSVGDTNEILFKPGTKFLTTSKKYYKSSQTWRITVQEVD